jgi:MFS family permease
MTIKDEELVKGSFLSRYLFQNHFLFINLGIVLALAISGLLGPMIKEVSVALSVQEWQINLIPTFFGISAAGFSFFWVFLENRFPNSRKKILIIATLIWATAISIIGFFFFFNLFTSYYQLLILMETASIGFAGIVPISYSITMDLYAPKKRAKAFGYIDTSSSLGTGFSPLLAGFLVKINWAIPFIIVGILGYFVNLFLSRVKEPKRGSQEYQLVNLVRSGVDYRFRLTKEGLKGVFRKKANLLLFGIIFFYVTSQAGLAYYFITMMKSDHLFTSDAATLIFLLIYQVQIYAPAIWGWYADKLYSKRSDGKIISIIISLSLGIVPYMIGYSLPFQGTNNLPIFIIFCILITFAAFAIMGVTSRTTSIIGEINPPEVRTTIFALNYLCDTGGSSLGFFIVGVLGLILFEGSYQYSMVLVCLGYAGSIILALIVRKMIPKELENYKSEIEDRARRLENGANKGME